MNERTVLTIDYHQEFAERVYQRAFEMPPEVFHEAKAVGAVTDIAVIIAVVTQIIELIAKCRDPETVDRGLRVPGQQIWMRRQVRSKLRAESRRQNVDWGWSEINPVADAIMDEYPQLTSSQRAGLGLVS